MTLESRIIAALETQQVNEGYFVGGIDAAIRIVRAECAKEPTEEEIDAAAKAIHDVCPANGNVNWQAIIGSTVPLKEKYAAMVRKEAKAAYRAAVGGNNGT